MKKEGEECCNNSSGVASVVLGIIGLVASVAVFPVVLSITALVFGIVQYKTAKNKWAVAGIVLSVLGIIIAALVFWKFFTYTRQFTQLIQDCQVDPTMPQCAQVAQLLGGAQ